MDVDNEANKCYGCGKNFRSPSTLAQHKARKTPCLIREVSEEDKHNPLRCIYCNKIFSKASNLTKHNKTCKIKHGGLDKLHDKVKHEEQLRIIKEESEQRVKAVEDKLAEQNAKIITQAAEHAAQMAAIMRKLERIESGVNAPPAINNTHINNGIVINYNVNNYTNPAADHLLTFEKFNEIFKKEFASLPVGLVCKLYFDPEHQENMSVHLINKSTGEMLTMCEGNWKTMGIDDVATQMRAVGYAIAKKGIKMHGKNITGEWRHSCGAVISNVSHKGAYELDMKDIKAKIVESREITGAAPHIAAKLASTRAVSRVRKVTTTSNKSPSAKAEDTTLANDIVAGTIFDNIADEKEPQSYFY